MIALGRMREDKGIIVVTAAWLFVGGTYSALSLLRYFSFHAGVFDLGVAYAQIYSVFHGLIGNGTIGDYQIQKSINLLMAPFFGLTGEIPYLLVFQSLWLSFGSIPLYYISRKFVRGTFVPAAVSLSYLFYYPLGGDYWFDFHFMAIFPTFFLLFYAFYLYGMRRAAMVSAILAMITDFLVPAIMIIGALTLLHSEWKDRGIRNSFAWAIVAVGTAIYVIVFLSYGTYSATQWINQAIVYPVNIPGLTEYYPLYLFLPVLFLSLLAPEYAIMLLPFLAFIYSNNYLPYFSLMFYQYPALFAPILFLSAAKGISRIGRLSRSRTMMKGVATALVAFNIILFAFLTPVGNLMTAEYDNQAGGIFTGQPFSYNTMQDITYSQQDTYLNEAIAMIPHWSTVMIQDNMPQLSYQYHWLLPEDVNASNLPQYALLDPYSSKFTGGSYYGSNESKTAILQANWLIYNYGYGILAELDGITLLERNYTGSAEFVPIDRAIGAGSFFFPGNSTASNGSEIIPAIGNGSYGFYGPYTFLTPGSYEITFKIYAESPSGNQSLDLQIANTSYLGQTVDLQVHLDSSYFGSLARTFTAYFNTTNFLSLVEFRAFNLHMISSIVFSGVQIYETGA